MNGGKPGSKDIEDTCVVKKIRRGSRRRRKRRKNIEKSEFEIYGSEVPIQVDLEKIKLSL